MRLEYSLDLGVQWMTLFGLLLFMENEGRYFTFFVREEEIAYAEAFLYAIQNGKSLGELYERAFELGRQAVFQEEIGNDLFYRDNDTRELVPLEETPIVMDDDGDKKIIHIDNYRKDYER